MTTIDNVLESAAPQSIANAMTRDYSLLRPFDLQAAMSGDPILWGGQLEPATFVARARKGETNIIERPGMQGGLIDNVQYALDEHLRMAPMCWIEGRPVYKGDRLWCKIYNEWVIAVDSRTGGVLNANGHEPGLNLDMRDCTWSGPDTLEKLIHDALGPHCVTSDDHRAAIEAVLAAHERWLTEHGLQRTRSTPSQARIEHLERIEAAALNLMRVKGRYHSEIAYQRLVAALEGAK